jgi:hypothetical protein
MGDILNKRAGDPVDAIWRYGRRRATFVQGIGGGLCANVVDGVLVGFGLEPVAGPFVPALHPAKHHGVLNWAAPIAGAAAAAAAAGAVATGLVWRHRRIA